MEDINWLQKIAKKQLLKQKSRNIKLKLEEIANVKKQKLTVQETTDSLNKGIEKYLAEAEEKRDFTLLSKANAFRKSVKEKQQALNDLNNAQKSLKKK